MSTSSRFTVLLFLVGTATGLSAAPEETKAVRSNVDMQVESDRINTQVQADYQQVLVLKGKAEKQKDIIKVTCVNDRLVQLKAEMNIADQRRAALKSALERNADDRNTLFADLSSTGDSIRKLREEASACLGEGELYRQESGVEVDKPDIIDDPTGEDPYETDPTLEVEPPGYASAFD